MKKFGLWGSVLVVFLALSVSAQGAIKTEEIEYKDGDTVMKGYIAYDDSISGKRPGILVVHEWWGHNEYARKRARMLAELGYTAFALDMYGDGKTADHPDDAGKFAGEVRKNMDVAASRFGVAMKLLQDHKTTDPEKIGAIGYCFGGGIVLEMARRGADLDGVVSFHGSLGTKNPAWKGKFKAKVLVAHGADDPFVPQEQVDAFKKEMDKAGVDYEIIVYKGAKHSFTNPEADKFGKKFDLPLAYNEKADKQSWEDMKTFFKEKVF
jgi:dienelactone hydrolase